MWEEAARIIEEKGGEVHLETKIVSLKTENNKITGIEIMDKNGNKSIVKGDYIFSTMPMKELISGIEADVPHEVRTVSEGLLYRDFLTVGLLCDKLKLKNETTIKTINNVVPDNWIYIQEASVTVGRLQVFNNWSPYLVKDKNTVWVGMEYFCDEKDELWNMADDDIKKLAIGELAKINVIETGDVLDTVVHRMPKAYPGYFGTYNKLSLVREFLDPFENLYLIGRNGMHRYNNMDHSMLTAMVAVDNIIEGRLNKDNIWNVNTEEDYHEEKAD